MPHPLLVAVAEVCATSIIAALAGAYPNGVIDVAVAHDWEGGQRAAENVSVMTHRSTRSPAIRSLWEQTILRWRSSKYDVVLGLAGFAPLWSRTPQIVFAQNALFFAPQPTVDLRSRLKNALRRSYFRMTIRSGAQCVAVSTYMAALVQRNTNPVEQNHDNRQHPSDALR